MAKKSKFFRVAVEGATSDGRTIDRDWLLQIAKHYDPKLYGARVNMEHIRGYGASGEFRAYGDVLAVKTEEVEIGGKKKLALLAQIDATDELVELNKRKQKLYTSIEVRPSFADLGEAYLVGLAVTDNPASLGTEMLEFAAKHPEANPFKARKEQPEDVFAVAEVFTLEMEEEAEAGMAAKFKARIESALAKFKGKTESDDARFDAMADGMQEMGDSFAEHASAVNKHQAKTDNSIKSLRADLDKLQKQYTQLDNTEQPGRRPVASGGGGQQQADF
ncbi:GPO family capsid scaffolding protein [Comamonas antarctica]|uniref:GPO family capsid scaffolding protein n=1 Tax=Comamonas antarctica TaxID=2743470 RepID=A0A6N1X3N4_9BURK|nr:GPO family capsid scaffolding protein [Comamonas antarctica]QKV52395.1 GPO family capsid scaffolding protein [Comamonas antarctica]